MKVWAIINTPPIAYDTAYLLGRIISRADEVHVTKYLNLSQIFRDAPNQFDVVLNRTISNDFVLIREIEEYATRKGARLINSSSSTVRACDKRTYLNDYSRFIPESWVVDSVDELHEIFSEVGYELVVKNPFGKFGKEVARFNGNNSELIVEKVIKGCRGCGFVVQRYCKGFSDGDKRIIVHRRVGGEFDIVAWYLRVPAEGHWISNLSAGGTITPASINKDEADFAIEISSTSELDYIGIDIGRDNGRLYLIETNAYTGGYMDFDAAHQNMSSGDEFAKFVCELGGQLPSS